MFKFLLALLALLASMSVVMGASAAPGMSAPSGKVILTVDGEIATSNSTAGKALFDLPMLDALPRREVRTRTPWTEGVTTFEGPLGTALLEAVGARGSRLEITAINDYSVEVPVTDLERHKVIFALRQNGELLRVRDKGPLFLVYPFDEDPALNSEVIQSRSIWQIRSIRVLP